MNYKEEDYKSIFIESLGINSKDFHQEIKYNEVNEWDPNWSYDTNLCSRRKI